MNSQPYTTITVTNHDFDPKLKPCPFCGGKKVKIDKDYRFPNRNRFGKIWSMINGECEIWAHFVFCPSCGAQGGWGKSESTAVHNWNMRIEARER